MKSVAFFFVYALALLNCFIWLIAPEFFYDMMWKLDIFWTLLFAPLIWSLRNETN